MGKPYTDYSSASAAKAAKQGLIFPDYNEKRVFHPSKMELGLQDVDLDSGRVSSGTMVRYRKGVKRTLNLTFGPMTTGQMASVLRALDSFGTVGVSSGSEAFFRVIYTDPRSGSSSDGYRVTKWFYAGDRTTPCYSEELGLWEELTVEVVER